MTLTKLTRRTLAILAVSLSGLHALPAWAQYPEKPIHLIVGAAAGDNTDIFARLLADKLSKALGQPVVVENKPGAGGTLAGAAGAAADADGYTLLYGNLSSLVVAPQVVSGASYDSTTDFTPIAQTEKGASILIARHDFAADDPAGLIEFAKSNDVTVGLNAVGSAIHVVLELVQANAGVTFTSIPYQGTGAATQAVVSGEADIAITGLLLAKPHIDSGAIKPIAIWGEKESALYPGLPTLAEALNIPEVGVDFWSGIVGPAGLDPAIAKTLSDAINTAMQEPEIAELITRNGQTFDVNTPEEFAAELATQWGAYGEVIKSRNITIQ